MARTIASLPAGKVHEILKETNRASIRERDLPAHVVVYYVIALALYMRSSYREVLRCLMEGVRWLLDPSVNVKVAGKSGISQARSRLRAEPLKKLYEAVVVTDRQARDQGRLVSAVARCQSGRKHARYR